MPDFAPTFAVVPLNVQCGDILTAAYRKAHAIARPGQGISPSEQAEGIAELNSMIDGFKMEDLLIPGYQRTLQNMAIGQKSYSVGPGQDFNIERAERIGRAGFIIGTDPNTAEIPMAVLLTYETYAQYVAKNVGSSIPLAIYYEPFAPTQDGNVFGQAIVWPVPTVVSMIAIYTPTWVQGFSSAEDPVLVPHGWIEMLKYALAVKIHELYPEKPWDPAIPVRAEALKSRVKYHQARPMFIGSDPAVMGEQRSQQWVGGNPKAWTPFC